MRVCATSLFLGVLFLLVSPAGAQDDRERMLEAFKKSKLRPKVMPTGAVRLNCDNCSGWIEKADSKCDPRPDGRVSYKLYQVEEGWDKDPRKGVVDFPSGQLKACFNSGEKAIDVFAGLAPKTAYFLVLQLPDVTSGKMLEKRIFFSTEAKAQIRTSAASTVKKKRFIVHSDVPLSADSNIKVFATPEGKGADHRREYPVSGDPHEIEGSVEILLEDSLRGGKSTLEITGLKDVLFGQPVTVKKEIDLSGPPKGKDDAQYYVKLNHSAGRGSFPSLGVDLKAAPNWFWLGDWLFRPEATIDVAKNLPSSANSVKFGGFFKYVEVLRESKAEAQDDKDKKAKGVPDTGAAAKPKGDEADARRKFKGFVLNTGTGFETDRDFDVTNLLAEFDFRPLFRGWNRTREARRAARLQAMLKEAEGKKAISLEDVEEAAWGVLAEFSIGTEAGSSLQDRIFDRKGIDGMLTVPRYGILRARPKVRFFFERALGLDSSVSLDVVSYLRFLIAEERAGEVVAKELSLRRVDGFRPYSTATFSLNFNQNLALTVDYKNGSSPPLFQNVNTVSTGLVYKY